MQSVQNLLARNRGHSASANEIKCMSDAEAARLLPDTDLALAERANLAVMRTLETAIAELEKTVLSRIGLRPEFRQLLSVSGIGQALGLTIMLETGTIARFERVCNSPRTAVAWAARI